MRAPLAPAIYLDRQRAADRRGPDEALGAEVGEFAGVTPWMLLGKIVSALRLYDLLHEPRERRGFLTETDPVRARSDRRQPSARLSYGAGHQPAP